MIGERSDLSNAEKLFETAYQKHRSLNNRIASYAVSLALLNILLFVPVLAAIFLGIETIEQVPGGSLVRSLFYLGYYILQLGVIILAALIGISLFRLIARNWRRLRPPHNNEKYLVLNFEDRESRVSVKRSGLHAGAGLALNLGLMLGFPLLLDFIWNERSRFQPVIDLAERYVSFFQNANVDSIILNTVGIGRVFDAVSLQNIILFCLGLVWLSFIIVFFFNLMFLTREYFDKRSDNSVNFTDSDVLPKINEYITAFKLIISYNIGRWNSPRGKKELRRTVIWGSLMLVLSVYPLFILFSA